MSLYRRYIIPFLIDRSMRNRRLTPYRREVAGAAEGRVLEIGLGSGLNLPHYSPSLGAVVGVEPDARLLKLAARRGGREGPAFEPVRAGAEALPFESASFDTVVSSFTLCSIPDAARALGETRRVLRPGGRFLFVEHGLSSDASVSRWQDRLDPAWTRISGGCHMNRPIAGLVAAAGFAIDGLRTEYAEGPRILTYLYVGRARPV
jgi:ubiquinone/menaquinone biosynthesis C-methylase UbiE